MSAKNRFALVATMAMAVMIVYAARKGFQPFVLAGSLIKPWLTSSFYLPLTGLFKHTLMSPAFYVVVISTLLLQKLLPANPKQKSFNISLAQDIVWFVYETLLNAIVITTYVYVLREIYRQHFNFLTIEAAVQWPAWLRFMSGVLLLDLLFWLQHYLNHKVPLLWRFHAVHHSQKALNFFTDYRYHIVEYIVRHTIVVIPFLVLKVSVPEIVAFRFLSNGTRDFITGIYA
jgi:sterol desaturase/sphingolipid hydroxylase (fatty acid hydroxylase superfamily)